MRRIRILLIGSMLLIYNSVSAGWVPQVVQDSLKQMFPNLKSAAWSTDNNYYVAGFEYNGFGTKIWLDSYGHWVMKQTDWQTLDQVPMPLYHTFTIGSYATDQIDDVIFIEFPHKQALIVILVQQPDIETKYQLFYTPKGELLEIRNSTGLVNPLGAAFFL